jgi:hypothetical protein
MSRDPDEHPNEPPVPLEVEYPELWYDPEPPPRWEP